MFVRQEDNKLVCRAHQNYHLCFQHHPWLLNTRFDQTAHLLIMSACLPAFIAQGSAFPSSSMCLLAQVKWSVLTNTGASGYVGKAELIRAHWLSLHWMVVIQTTVCVCECLSVWWWGGVALLPLLLCLLYRVVGLFLLWEQTVALSQS